jgi:hypothetical protein
MSPPWTKSAGGHPGGVALIARDTGFTEQTLYTRRRSWQQQGDLVPATGKSAEQWSAVAKFAVVFQTAGLNGIEPGAFKPGAGPVSATGCPLAAGCPGSQQHHGSHSAGSQGAAQQESGARQGEPAPGEGAAQEGEGPGRSGGAACGFDRERIAPAAGAHYSLPVRRVGHQEAGDLEAAGHQAPSTSTRLDSRWVTRD